MKNILEILKELGLDVPADKHSTYALSSYASGVDYAQKLSEKYGGGRDIRRSYDGAYE